MCVQDTCVAQACTCVAWYRSAHPECTSVLVDQMLGFYPSGGCTAVHICTCMSRSTSWIQSAFRLGPLVGCRCQISSKHLCTSVLNFSHSNTRSVSHHTLGPCCHTCSVTLNPLLVMCCMQEIRALHLNPSFDCTRLAADELFQPEDILPFTRRQILLIVDSDISTEFKG